MHTYEFVFVVDGFDLDNDEQLMKLEDLFEDVSAARTRGMTTLQFCVEAASSSDALHGTLRTLNANFDDLKVVRLDRDLVGIPDIAARSGRTPESIRLLVNGQRGQGGFPPPQGVLGGGTAVWEWAEVAAWLSDNGIHDEECRLIDHECATLFDAHLAVGSKPSEYSVRDHQPVTQAKPVNITFISHGRGQATSGRWFTEAVLQKLAGASCYLVNDEALRAGAGKSQEASPSGRSSAAL